MSWCCQQFYHVRFGTVVQVDELLIVALTLFPNNLVINESQ